MNTQTLEERETLGREAYNAYRRQADNGAMPAWEDLNAGPQGEWRNVAAAVCAAAFQVERARLADLIERERVAIASWDEERKRNLREAWRVCTWRDLANNLGKMLLEEYATPAHQRRISALLGRLDELNEGIRDSSKPQPGIHQAS